MLAGWREWLEALVEKPSVDASRAALLIAAESVDEGLVPRTQVEAAEIVLTRDGRMVDVDPQTVFLPANTRAPTKSTSCTTSSPRIQTSGPHSSASASNLLTRPRILTLSFEVE